MKAINDHVLIKAVKQAPKKVGGLLITDHTDTEGRYVNGEVVSISEGFEYVKDGDIVWYDRHAGHSITYDGDLYRVIRIRDIAMVDDC